MGRRFGLSVVSNVFRRLVGRWHRHRRWLGLGLRRPARVPCVGRKEVVWEMEAQADPLIGLLWRARVLRPGRPRRLRTPAARVPEHERLNQSARLPLVPLVRRGDVARWQRRGLRRGRMADTPLGTRTARQVARALQRANDRHTLSDVRRGRCTARCTAHGSEAPRTEISNCDGSRGATPLLYSTLLLHTTVCAVLYCNTTQHNTPAL